MCGLGAILRTDGEPIPGEWLDLIDARIAHRGPDDAGRFRDRAAMTAENDLTRSVEIAMVHRRLSIIDLADGRQPMVDPPDDDSAADRIAVIFNGCIYNHRALRTELESAGRTFQTDHSDTEVLLHGWREWGPALANRLEGMYAFALWDRSSGELIVGRDWFGQKPLYVAHADLSGNGGATGADDRPDLTVVASDPLAVARVIEAATGEPIARSVPAFAPWLAGYLLLGYGWKGATPYGHAIQADQRAVTAAPIGLPDDLSDASGWRPWRIDSDPAEFEQAVEEAIEQAVVARLEADVPLGCFLSGGVDSSLIASFAKKHRPGLRTFSVRMPDARYDESAHAERVAAHLGADHTTLDPAIDPVADLQLLVDRMGQPFGDSSILPTFWVSRAAREHVKVALSGDGGDELFFGYERYFGAPILTQWRWLLRFMPSSLGARSHPKSRRHNLGRLIRMARDLDAAGLLAMEAIFEPRDALALIDGDARPALPALPPGSDPLVELRNADLRHYLPGDLLMKVDAASMAVALEVRCPFLDRSVARLAIDAAPQLVHRGRRKGLLRDIARKHLPAEIVDRPKMGFAIPIGEWFRENHRGLGGLLNDSLRSTDAFGDLPVNRAVAVRFLDEHMNGVRDHGQRLFALLTLALWAQRDGSNVAGDPSDRTINPSELGYSP